MQVIDILTPTEPKKEVQLIKERCSRFILESDGLPLFKSLPSTYPSFHRVKVRHRKQDDLLAEAMNVAFESKNKRFAQRAIFASSTIPKLNEGTETFYVFPVDGFHYLYNKEVKESIDLEVLSPVIEQFGEEKGVNTIAEILKFTYTSNRLSEGIESGAEIILYGIPYYYALKTSAVSSYEDLLTDVLDI